MQARELTPAEEQLIEACQKGEPCGLGDGELPPEGTPDPNRHIHADVLRYLILGGCDDCIVDDIGVWVEGAHVTGTLDLDFTIARGAIRMSNSRFDKRFDCEQTKCRQLGLNGCDLQGLRGPTMKVTGDVLLNGITTNATINLNSATIGGQLNCKKAAFKVKEGFALNAQSANVTADVFLGEITTNATIHLSGATFGGQLNCKDATFEVKEGHALNAQGANVTNHVFLNEITTKATIDLHSATIGGQLICEKARFEVEEGHALHAESAKINGGLFWRGATVTKGKLSFANAHTSSLTDDESSWPSGGRVSLNGLTYDTIIGAPLDAKTRLIWLDKGSNWGGEFTPQPYTQLAKVLRNLGHDSDARSILLQRDLLLGPPNRARLKMIPDGTWKVGFQSLWFDITHPLRVIVDYMFRLIAGYGHRPFRSIPILLALIFITIIPAHYAWVEGSFAPNSAIIQESQGWKEHQLESNPAKSWSEKGAAGNDWETFNRYAYGLDVVIPIINFGQTEAWAPSTNRGWWGKQLYWMRWVLGALGWIVTALGAAAITGVIRRD